MEAPIVNIREVAPLREAPGVALLILLACSALIGLAAVRPALGQSQAGANAVVLENQNPGDETWQYWKDPSLAGLADDTSQ